MGERGAVRQVGGTAKDRGRAGVGGGGRVLVEDHHERGMSGK